MKKLCIIGCGGFAREAYTIISSLGWEEKFYAFFQSDSHYIPNTKLYGIDILPISHFDPNLHQAVIAIGDSVLREKIFKEMPADSTYYKLIHPNVIISKHNVEIDVGAIICAGTILTCDIKIGQHVILNLSSTIGHDCVIDDFFTTAPGVNMSGRCNIGKRVYIGTNASLRGHNKICDDVIVGMGAVILKDITESGTYIGNPIRKLEKKSA